MRTDKIILKRDVTVSVGNPERGRSGRLIVKQDETGGHSLFLAPGQFGNISIEPAPGTLTLLKWIADDEGVYWTSAVLTPTEDEGIPAAITDLRFEAVNTVTARIRWSAPMSSPTDVFSKVSRYRIFISEAELTPANMEGNREIKNKVAPASPLSQESFVISGLLPGHKYYVAVVSEKFLSTRKKVSLISNVISFSTRSAAAASPGKLIPVQKSNVYSWLAQYQYNTNHDRMGPGGLTDYSKIVINDLGVPEGISDAPLSIFNYGLLDTSRYNENSVKLRMELDGLYNLEYFYCWFPPDFVVNFTVSCSDDGVHFRQLAQVTQPAGREQWVKISIDKTLAEYSRYVELNFRYAEQSLRGFLIFGTRTETPGVKGSKFKRLHPLMAFNDYAGTNAILAETDPLKINGIATPVRLLNESGWIIQAELAETAGSGASLAPDQVKYRFSKSDKWNFDEKLQQFVNSGLKPHICINHAPLYLRVQDNAEAQRRKAVDPGLDIRDLSVTTNPLNYKHFSRLAYNLSARYGANAAADETFIQLIPAEPLKKGLNYVQYYEFLNEHDNYRLGQDSYHSPAEMAACLSALSDGNKGDLGPGYGIKQADPNARFVMNALASPHVAYARQMCSEWDLMRGEGNYPVDVLNIHLFNYWEEAPGTEISSSVERYGAHPEGSEFRKTLNAWTEFRDIYLPGRELWITATGYDEHKNGVQSPPDLQQRQRSLHKAFWLMRTFLLAQSFGADVVFQYSYSNDSGLKLGNIDPVNGSRNISLSPGYTEGETSATDLNRKKLVSYYYMAALRHEMQGYTFSHTILDAGEPLTLNNPFRTVSPHIFALAYTHPEKESIIVTWLGLGDFSTLSAAVNVGLSENSVTVISFNNVEVREQETGTINILSPQQDGRGRYISLELSELPLIIRTSDIGVAKLRAPENIYAESTAPDTVKLAWLDRNTSNNITKIFQSDKPGSDYALVSETLIDDAEYLVSGLTAGTDYYFRIQFEEGLKQSDLSSVIGIRTLAALPEGPEEPGSYDTVLSFATARTKSAQFVTATIASTDPVITLSFNKKSCEGMPISIDLKINGQLAAIIDTFEDYLNDVFRFTKSDGTYIAFIIKEGEIEL